MTEMERQSDLEELLAVNDVTSTEVRGVTRGRVLGAVAAVAVIGVVAAVALGGVPETRLRAGREFLGLDEEDPDSCFTMGMYYAKPVKLATTARTIETTAELCQQRCQVVEECTQFTFWPDGGCLLTDDTSFLKAAPFKYSGTITGPKFCPGAVQDAKDAISAAVDDDENSVNVVEAGIPQAQSTWDKDGDAKAEAATAVAVEVTPGVNGTSCGLYPACVAVGIKEGDCCPNADKVSLGCCQGFPKIVEEVKIAVGSECEKFPACVKLNITGGCCPTPDGVQLGCCAAI